MQKNIYFLNKIPEGEYLQHPDWIIENIKTGGIRYIYIQTAQLRMNCTAITKSGKNIEK